MSIDLNCTLCPALCASRTQVVFPTPCPAGGLLVIGEGPGSDEDRVGYGFAGRAGKTLEAVLAEHGIGPKEFGRTNAVWCRPPSNRKPAKAEIANCQAHLYDAIVRLQPSVLLLVGGSAATAVLGGKLSLHERIKESASEPVIIRNHFCRAVAMPHVSPLAWNRFAPNGERWADIGRRQVAVAVSLARSAVTVG